MLSRFLCVLQRAQEHPNYVFWFLHSLIQFMEIMRGLIIHRHGKKRSLNGRPIQITQLSLRNMVYQPIIITLMDQEYATPQPTGLFLT